MSVKRHVSEEYLRAVSQELKDVSKTARRIGYTRAGTYRALYRFGIRRKK